MYPDPDGLDIMTGALVAVCKGSSLPSTVHPQRGWVNGTRRKTWSNKSGSARWGLGIHTRFVVPHDDEGGGGRRHGEDPQPKAETTWTFGNSRHASSSSESEAQSNPIQSNPIQSNGERRRRRCGWGMSGQPMNDHGIGIAFHGKIGRDTAHPVARGEEEQEEDVDVDGACRVNQ